MGEPVLRDLFGAMHDFKADRAYLVTTGRLTQPAAKWADGKPITVWDGEKVAELSKQAASRKTVAKPIVHNTVDPTSPEPAGSPAGSAGVSPARLPLPVPELACPKCGRILIERRNRVTGAPFLACPGFPACRYTRQLPSFNGG